MQIRNSLSEIVAYRKQRSHRIEALTDGVFAIVMTLLVLDIRTPFIKTDSEAAIIQQLIQLLPKILTYMLSFSVLGQLWSIFTNQFNFLHTSDRNEHIIALFFLMFVSLLPFSTSFLSEHLWSRIAVGFYIFNIVLIICLNNLHWYYAFHAGLIKPEGAQTIDIHKAIIRRAKAAFIGYSIVMICCFFNSYLAIFGTIALHIIFKFTGFIEMFVLFRRNKIKRGNKKLITEPAPGVIDKFIVQD